MCAMLLKQWSLHNFRRPTRMIFLLETMIRRVTRLGKVERACLMMVLLICLITVVQIITRQHESAVLELGNDGWSHALYSYLLRPSQCCLKLSLFGGNIIPGHSAALDGDKMVCLDEAWRPPTNRCLVYSFGINHEWSFDRAITSRLGCNVMAFDPSMSTPDNGSLTEFGARFFQIGLSSGRRDEAGWHLASLAQLRRALGHSLTPLHFLKVDVEGSEWEWIEQETRDTLSSVWQIAVEVHLKHVRRPLSAKRYVLALRRLQDIGFQLAYSQANRALAASVTVEGIAEPVSQCYELLLLNTNIQLPQTD